MQVICVVISDGIEAVIKEPYSKLKSQSLIVETGVLQRAVLSVVEISFMSKHNGIKF